MSFSPIQGQEHAIQILENFLANNRIPHAMLFYGPQGIGKKMTATALSYRILKNPSDREHPDFHRVELDDKAIKIDTIRSLIKKISLKPLEGERSVILIDNAENMTESSANALLKTLEEPPEHVVLILVTSSKEQLLPTIVSRCQTISFSPLSSENMKRVLKEKGIPQEEWNSLLSLADGSPGKALNFPEKIKDEFRTDFFTFLEQLPRVSFMNIQKWAETLSQSDTSYPLVFQLMQNWIRDRLVVHSPEDSMSQGALLHISQLAIEAEQALAQNANKQLAWERLFLRWGH
jgi:DNA polymerase III subunit delta'